jgi:hypothetical protein
LATSFFVGLDAVIMMLRRLAPLFSITSHAEVLGVLIVVLSVAVLSVASAMKNGILQEPFIDLASPVAMSAAGETSDGRRHDRSHDSIARNQNAEPESTSGTVKPGFPSTVESSVMDEVDQYLWAVYERSPTKRDSTGDFTWKDVSAAWRLGMSVETYVIGGMDPDLRELLYRAGLAMDEAGIHWTILSAFRDDYRQSLVSGFKAHTDNSLHGGSVATGGYGHGCAVDIMDADGNSNILWQWLDTNSARIGLQRLLPRADPAHVQPRGEWHELAVALRNYRLGSVAVAGETVTINAPTASTATLSDRESACVKLRHWEGDSLQAEIPTSPMRGLVKAKATAQTHALAEKLNRNRATVATRTFRTAKLPVY